MTTTEQLRHLGDLHWHHLCGKTTTEIVQYATLCIQLHQHSGQIRTVSQ